MISEQIKPAAYFVYKVVDEALLEIEDSLEHAIHNDLYPAVESQFADILTFYRKSLSDKLHQFEVDLNNKQAEFEKEIHR